MTNNDNVKYIASCLIKAFKNMQTQERNVTINNTFLCNSTLKSKLSEEKYNKLLEMKNTTEWEMAWVLLDDELQTDY